MRFSRSLSFYCSLIMLPLLFFFFFFNDTATTEIYTLSLHDALPILAYACRKQGVSLTVFAARAANPLKIQRMRELRSEEHTSELQSQSNLVCRLLLEKKKKKNHNRIAYLTIT